MPWSRDPRPPQGVREAHRVCRYHTAKSDRPTANHENRFIEAGREARRTRRELAVIRESASVSAIFARFESAPVCTRVALTKVVRSFLGFARGETDV